MLLAWVVHHPCDGMNGESQIQSAVRVDPHEHARKFQMLGLDVRKNLWRAVSFERSRREGIRCRSSTWLEWLDVEKAEKFRQIMEEGNS